MKLGIVYTLAICVVELNDLWHVELEVEVEGEDVRYPSGLWDFDDGEVGAIETLHLCVEFFVTDDEDDVYCE